MAILWTVQHADAYKRMKEYGILTADDQHMFCGDDLRFAYDWIAQKMRERLGLPPIGVSYPVWAWYQQNGIRKRCDLRKAGYAPRGTPMVQIEFEADDDAFLLSDFDDWHCVLNNCYIADSEKEFDAFYECKHVDKQAEIEKSWEKVFDLHRCCLNWGTPLDRKTIQATLWSVRAEQIRKVDHFTAR